MNEHAFILVVEDSEMCRANIEIALGSLPVQTRFVSTAEEALSALESSTVSALVTDLQLPAMSGLELIGEVRSRPRWRNLPIVVTSGESDPRIPQRVIEAGANAYFAKPYSPAAIRQKLEQLIHAQ